MKDNLKNPRTTAAIVIVAIIIFGALVFSLGNKEDDKAAQNTKNTISKQESADKSNQKAKSKVAAAETSTPSTAAPGDIDLTGAYNPSQNTVATTVGSTPAAAQTPANPTPSAGPNPPAVNPEAPPVVNPEIPPSEDPEVACEANGRVIVYVGGVSCSYTIATTDGSVVQWELPYARSFSADGSTVNDTDTPVHVVIESTSQAGEGEPWTAASITYHYRAAEAAPAGDFDDVGGDLTFYTLSSEGELEQDFSQPLTLAEPPVTP